MKQKILIIDDETDFCLIMRNYLMKNGQEVFSAYTLREGMALLKETRPDILFLDNNLPDGNGWDSVKEIVELIPQIRVYLCSAHRNNSPLARNNENVIVWEKPISLTMLDPLFKETV
jgi:two-component system OmpR family response regulator